MPEAEEALKLAPQQPPPLATPADKLPVAKLKLPKNFNIEVFAAGLTNARSLRLGDKGTLFVSTRVLDRIYAVTDKDVELAAYNSNGKEIYREPVVVRRSSNEPDRPNDVGLIQADLPRAHLAALDLARRISRADPRPGREDIEAAIAAGLRREAAMEVAGMAAAGTVMNRVMTLLALPPESLEKVVKSPLFRFIRPLMARRVRLRQRAAPEPPPRPNDGPGARLVAALGDSPMAGVARRTIDGAWASTVLPRRTPPLPNVGVSKAKEAAAAIGAAVVTPWFEPYHQGTDWNDYEAQHDRDAYEEIITELDAALVDRYFCNFSLFQSLPDSWAIDQLFPIMPIHRLTEEPVRRGTLQDVTCDSDGKIDRFCDLKDVKEVLELHPYRRDEPYYLGMFLVGAYQDVMGSYHNLFGQTNEAQIVIEAWRQHYNRVRPHSSLGYRPPAPEIVAWPASPAVESARPAIAPSPPLN